MNDISQTLLFKNKDITKKNIQNEDYFDWSFADKTIKDTAYITHGYYTYPAKFIPQLAEKLIKKYSQEGDVIIDPFMGSGTTIVEAIINNRRAIGIDINEIAVLVSKVKSTPIENHLLEKYSYQLIEKLRNIFNFNFEKELILSKEKISLPKRIDYWFVEKNKNKLLVILKCILEIKNEDVKNFFCIAFAQILKSCSIWLQKSVKPTRDKNKKETDPLIKFEWQIKKMLKKHFLFNNFLSSNFLKNIDNYRKIINSNSYQIPCENDEASLIVTSPPYVTSYEYADLHQLPSLWFGYLEELAVFRKKFIGSSYREFYAEEHKKEKGLKSKIAEKIVSQLKNKKQREVQNYFADMLQSFLEMKRVLKKGGKAAIVIGNTKFQGVDILNAEVFQEQFKNIGFSTHEIIEREIPSKMLPSTRDPKTGQFTKASSKNKKLVYPTEKILIMEKM